MNSSFLRILELLVIRFKVAHLISPVFHILPTANPQNKEIAVMFTSAWALLMLLRIVLSKKNKSETL